MDITSHEGKLRVVVPEHLTFETVRSFVRNRMGMSRTLMRRLKQEDGIFVNGESAGLKTPLDPGDVIELDLREDETLMNIRPEPIPLSIVHEDSDLIVLDKPQGMVVHPVFGYTSGTLANAVAHHMITEGVQAKVRPVHRLDRETSGLVVFAKHAFAQARLSEQLDTGRMRRHYVAITHGWFPRDEGSIQAPIRRADHPVKREVAPIGAGQRAVTNYHVLHRWKDATAVLCWLETGRTHQIRVHLAYFGHPLLGDTLYGGNTELIERQALHACRLGVRHPVSMEACTWNSPLPADIQACITRINEVDGGKSWSGDLRKMASLIDRSL